MEPWLKRMIDLMRERGLNEAQLSEAAGLHRSSFQKYHSGTKPGSKALMGLAKALNTTPDFILEGKESGSYKIPVVGIASAGEGWRNIPGNPSDYISFDMGGRDPIAIEVRGDSMNPVYRDRDILLCSRQTTKYLDNLIGLDCVVMTEDGDGYIKILKRGSRKNTVILKSYNPLFEDIENVRLLWVAPILWVRRGR